MDLIDVPKEYYEELTLFDSPKQLMNIFSSLEEDNLQ